MLRVTKQIIKVIALIFITLIIISNLIFVTTIENNYNEIANIKIVGITIFISIIISIIIYLVFNNKIINNERVKTFISKYKKYIIAITVIIFFTLQVIWINYRDIYPTWDQYNVYRSAVAMKNNDLEYIQNNKGYLSQNQHQLGIVAIFTAILKVFNTEDIHLIQYINAFANALSLIAILLICKILKNDYKINSKLSVFIYLTFLSIPMLSTFIYGDQIGLCFSLFGTFFLMQYGTKKRIYFFIVSVLLYMISYIARTNNLIFIISGAIYLLFQIMKKSKAKEYFKNILILILFLIIGLVPNTLLRNYMINKYQYEKDANGDTLAYILMGMSKGEREDGWYVDVFTPYSQYNNTERKKIYKDKINERLIEFKSNPIYFLKFYTRKQLSMYTENTYQACWYNQTFNESFIPYMDNSEQYINRVNEDKDNRIIEFSDILAIYQKALILLIFTISLIVILQNRKNLNNEICLLLIIFIGGILFHTIWEAKSRYVIPYIVILIPIASIYVEKIKFKRIKSNEK